MLEQEGGPRPILFICDFNAHGGTQTHLLHLFETLDRRRFRPILVTLNLHPELARRLGALDVGVRNLELQAALSPATLARAAALASTARHGAALLHGYLFQGNLLTAAVSRLSGVPCITSVRNVDLWKKTRHRLASAAAHRRARCVLFNSTAVRDYTVARERIAVAKTVVIYNGVANAGARPAAGPDVELFEPGRPTAICVASLRPKKGHAHLLEAFRQVLLSVPAARLLLIGEGPLRDELKALARARGLGDAVLFAGYRPDVTDLLKSADVFVLSSLEEGMPNALLEAMSVGLPSVVTDVGGVSEVVDDQRTGFLVPPAAPEAMAPRLAALLADVDLRRRQGAEARRRYEERFTLERMTRAYESLYDQVLAG